MWRQRLGVMYLPAKEPEKRWQLLEATRGKAGFVPGAFRESTALPTPWFQTSSLQNREIIYVCCFQPPGLWHFPTAPQETRGDTEPSSLLAEKQALHLPGEWQSPVRLDVLLYDSADAALSLSSPSLFISREKIEQRASWGMRLPQEKHSTGDGDRKGLGASFLALGTLHVLHHCRWTESLDCLGMEAPSSSTLHTADACKTSTGAREGCARQTPGCTPGKGCDHHSRGSGQGQRQCAEVCLLPNPGLERHPLSGQEKRGENSRNKAHGKSSMPRAEENVICSLQEEGASGKRASKWYFRKVERAFAIGCQRTQLLWKQEQGITRSFATKGELRMSKSKYLHEEEGWKNPSEKW